MLKFPAFRISTMTVFGHLGAVPNLKQLFDNGSFIHYSQMCEGILKMQLNGETRGICTDDILHTSAKKKKQFLHQASIVFRQIISNSLTTVPVFKEINIKLFRNGGFQMTGINSESMARQALNALIEMNKGDEKGVWETTPFIQKFNICLINSDYSVGQQIRRDRLHRIFIEEYGLRSFFEPTIYQGINTKYFWNKHRLPDDPPGICGCPAQCLGNGDGMSIGACKTITIAPFRTGKVIINGAQCVEQIQEAYEFMNQVLNRHAKEVLWTPDMEGSGSGSGSRSIAVSISKKPVYATTIDLLQRKSRTTPKHMVKLPALILE